MKKIKMASVAMVLSLSVSGVALAQKGFVGSGEGQEFSENLGTFIGFAQGIFINKGGVCAMLRKSPLDSNGKPMFVYDIKAMVPPGYTMKGWVNPCDMPSVAN